LDRKPINAPSLLEPSPRNDDQSIFCGFSAWYALGDLLEGDRDSAVALIHEITEHRDEIPLGFTPILEQVPTWAALAKMLTYATLVDEIPNRFPDLADENERRVDAAWGLDNPEV
jgi:hypothetical protein